MRKEEFFEILGELDDDIVKGATLPMKKKVNWSVWTRMAASLAVVAVIGMGLLYSSHPAHNEPPSSMKPVINFEGVVTAVDEDGVTLKDGKIVLITEETRFMSDPDMGNVVSEEILVGNFIQGYTEDNADAAKITASKIWTNEGRSSGVGKRVINFEGRVTMVEQGNLTLDNGKIVSITESTTVTAPDGSTASIVVGDYIQGYAQNVENSEITAEYVLVTTL